MHELLEEAICQQEPPDVRTRTPRRSGLAEIVAATFHVGAKPAQARSQLRHHR